MFCNAFVPYNPKDIFSVVYEGKEELPIYALYSQSCIIVCYGLNLDSKRSKKNVWKQQHENDFIQIILFTKSNFIAGLPKSDNCLGEGNTILC